MRSVSYESSLRSISFLYTPSAEGTNTKSTKGTEEAQEGNFLCLLCSSLSLNRCSLECGEHARLPEWNAAETHSGRVIDCVGDRGNRGFADRLAGAVLREIGPL